MNIFRKFESRMKEYAGIDTPTALTSAGWDAHNAKYKATHPVLYFIFEVVVASVESNASYYIVRPWCTFWRGLRNRFVTHSAQVRIQSLNTYTYHDPSEVLLHANFQVLVDFVEWEIGIFDRPKWYKVLRRIPIVGYFVPCIRNADEGLKHLEWESKLVYDSDWGVDANSEKFGKPVPQAIAATEKRDLYLWWKNVRPNREDSMDASGLTKHYGDKRSAGDDMFGTRSNSEITAWKVLSDECARIEKMYDDEDTTNLIRLIQIRQTLWT